MKGGFLIPTEEGLFVVRNDVPGFAPAVIADEAIAAIPF